MTDYLTNLLDRAFDRAAVIQPPRASLFAPAPLTSGATSDGHSTFAIDARAGAVETIDAVEDARLRGHRAPQPSKQNSSRQRSNVETFNDPSTAATRLIATRDESRHEPSVYPTPVAPARAQSAPLDAKAEAKSSPRESFLEPNPLETIRAPELASPESAGPESARPESTRPESASIDEEGLLAKMRALIPKPSPDAPSRENDRVEKKSLPAPVVDARASEKFESPAVAQHPSVFHKKTDEAPPSPPISPRLSSPPPSPLPLQPAAPAPASPTIQVTIGRIEVRASSAPAPPHKPAGGPRLTLDAYLRQRDGHNGGAQ
jgi:hypothetical protein